MPILKRKKGTGKASELWSPASGYAWLSDRDWSDLGRHAIAALLMASLFQMASSLLATYAGAALKDMVTHANTPLKSKCWLAWMKSGCQPEAFYLLIYFSDPPGRMQFRIKSLCFACHSFPPGHCMATLCEGTHQAGDLNFNSGLAANCVALD